MPQNYTGNLNHLKTSSEDCDSAPILRPKIGSLAFPLLLYTGWDFIWMHYSIQFHAETKRKNKRKGKLKFYGYGILKKPLPITCQRSMWHQIAKPLYHKKVSLETLVSSISWKILLMTCQL